MTQLAHLARRFVGSLSRRPPSDTDLAWALQQLLPGEKNLWLQMAVQDRRHSIEVAHRFVRFARTDDRAAIAGALLHDVGKSLSGLSTFGRVAATILGPRTKRFRLYHDHEEIGAEVLRVAGSAPETLALLDGTSALTQALREADAT